MPWFMDLHVDGRTVREIVEATPRFRFEGDGKLSTRRIVPETTAAVDLLNGASGAKVERALRGLLATFDAQSGVANLESIGFSTDGASAAINHLLGGMSWPDAEITPPIDPAAKSRERRQVKASIEHQARELDEAHADGASWGVSYRSINVSPATTNALFDALAGADVPPEVVDEQTHVLVHELAHRLTEPPLGDPAFKASDEPSADQLQAWSRMQLLSEGSADLITHMPGVKNDAQLRMGLPVAPEQPFQSGYAMFVDALTAILHQAGLEPSAPEHRQEVIELLERTDMEQVPDAIATMVVQRQGIEWSRHHEVAEAIARIGEHGLMPGETVESHEAVAAALQERTAQAEDLIGRLAHEARMHRERRA